MKRIDTATAVPDLFGSGKPGFRDGNLASGQVPTDLNAKWFNQIQEELARVIEAAGLTLDESNLAQLLAALSLPGVFATPAAGDNTTRAATTAFVRNASPASLGATGWQRLPSGLIMQWGSILVPTATGAFFTFPIAFPNACLSVSATLATAAAEIVYSNGASNVGINLDSSPGNSVVSAQVFAIGW